MCILCTQGRKYHLQLSSSFSAAHLSDWFLFLTSLTFNLKIKGLVDLFVYLFTGGERFLNLVL